LRGNKKLTEGVMLLRKATYFCGEIKELIN
jgi:hypothetical protein